MVFETYGRGLPVLDIGAEGGDLGELVGLHEVDHLDVGQAVCVAQGAGSPQQVQGHRAVLARVEAERCLLRPGSSTAANAYP